MIYLTRCKIRAIHDFPSYPCKKCNGIIVEEWINKLIRRIKMPNIPLKQILKKLFPQTISELQNDAVTDYAIAEWRQHIDLAENNTPYYIHGDTQENGKHHLYKVTIVDEGEHETKLVSPNGKEEKVFYKNGFQNY